MHIPVISYVCVSPREHRFSGRCTLQINYKSIPRPAACNSRFELGIQSTRGPVARVEPILQVDACLPDQFIGADEIPVEHLQNQHRVLRERRLHLQAPGRGGGEWRESESLVNRVMRVMSRVVVKRRRESVIRWAEWNRVLGQVERRES